MSSRAYYNEFDPKAAAWLRELIKEGLIAPGDVDERSITDVLPSDLHGYTQCHFFAGIGGWSYALRLAGAPDDQPVWTGSCPCQPFSAAGKQLGTADERHLWPAFARLIQAKRPPIVFGEQVASAAGRSWLAGVFADLEGMAYYRAAADLCAAGVGAPHIRQRLYWMAHAAGERRIGESVLLRAEETEWREVALSEAAGSSSVSRLADSMQSGRTEGRTESGKGSVAGSGEPCGMADPMRERRRSGQPRSEDASDAGIASQAGYWSDFDWLPCLDGKARRVESGTFPLVNGVSGRVGLLRGYGNAIVPQVAAQFIQAAFEAIGDHDGRSDVLMDDPAF